MNLDNSPSVLTLNICYILKLQATLAHLSWGAKLHPQTQAAVLQPSNMDETDVERESFMFVILSTFVSLCSGNAHVASRGDPGSPRCCN